MAVSLRKAYLYRETVLDKHKKPIVNGRKAAFIREQVVDSRGRVVKSKVRDIAKTPLEPEPAAR